MLRVLDLFSGIGGFSLGLERTGGFETVAFCEIEPFPRQVLAKHWPNVPIYEDVRELTADRLAADGIAPDVICGGFPCQDISSAGGKAGIDGDRSGLWAEYARLVGELRPAFVLVENVADLLARGLGRVLGDLATLGYDAEWNCIPASHLGAPHRRDRVWLVAYPADFRRDQSQHSGDVFCPPRQAREGGAQTWAGKIDADGSLRGRSDVADANSLAPIGTAIARQERHPWPAEPSLGRVVDGVSRRVVEPRLRALGNAVVPQIPELIGRAILAAEADRLAA